MTETQRTPYPSLPYILIADRPEGDTFVVAAFPALDHALWTVDAMDNLPDDHEGYWPEGYDALVVCVDDDGAATAGWHDVRDDVAHLDVADAQALLLRALN